MRVGFAIGGSAAALGLASAAPVDSTYIQPMTYAIIAANVAVFAGWRVSSLRSFFHRHMTLNSHSNSLIPMIASSYSHQSALHLGFNMFALHSMLPAVASLMGPSLALGCYTSSALIASLASTLYRRSINSVGLSVGASGGIVGLASIIAYTFPSAQFSIIFLPFLHFDAIQLMGGFAALSIAGLLKRNLLPSLDHAGHLGGIVGGLASIFALQQYYSRKRQPGRTKRRRKKD